MNEHLDLDALADLLVEVGDDSHAAHLEGCSDCRARLAELSAAQPAVSSSLGLLDLPEEPADLAARVDAALAAEATFTPTTTPTTTPTATPTTTPTATADVLPLEARAGGRAGQRSRTRWLPALAGVAAVAVLVTGGVLVAQQGGDDDGTTSAGSRFETSSSGTDYSRATLPQAVPGILDGAPTRSSQAQATDAAGPETLKSESDPLAPLRSTEGLARCLSSVLDPDSDELPLAVDYAAYEGKPALVVLLPTTQDRTVDVFVVGAQCDQADADLLYFTRVTTPS